MDENAAKERPSWAADGSEPKEIPVVPLERTFARALVVVAAPLCSMQERTWSSKRGQMG